MGDADTILAVSTPVGYARRAVVRLSGPNAVSCVAGRFQPTVSPESLGGTFRALNGRFQLAGEGVPVPALLYLMRAPRSYTREDVAELHLPGSPALLDMILDDLLEHGPPGLRPAEPGEFTRRAFVNGRIDLCQAEAVLSVVRARTESELLAATARLEGSVSRRCANLQDEVTELRVQAEAALDFAPHGIELLDPDEFIARCRTICREVRAEAEKGRGDVASDGHIRVVICGPPNAGKSSLLNRLARGETALVHDTPGTTRDAVDVEVEIKGVPLRLTDTAGLAEGACGPDAEAVKRARQRVESAQLALVVMDGSRPLPERRPAMAEAVRAERLLWVVNKCDLPRVWEDSELEPSGAGIAHTSALTGEELEGLREVLWRMVAEGRLDASPANCLFNARQRHALRRAVEEIGSAEDAVRRSMGYEFAAFNLRRASEALGEVTGEATPQDVLDRIFSRFCIGK